MTWGDYLSQLAWRPTPTSGEPAALLNAELNYIQTVTPLAAGAGPTALDRWKKEPTAARRDAQPAPGKHPVVLYAPGMDYPAVDNATLCETLAARGFVVLACPSVGCDSRRMSSDALGLDAQAQDLAFLAGYAHALPYADTRRLGVIGYSWGGLADVLFTLRDTRVQAVVSLDGALQSANALALARTFPQFRPERLRADLLLIQCSPEKALRGFTDRSFLENAVFAETVQAVFAEVEHHDLSVVSGRLRRDAQAAKGVDWSGRAAAYKTLCGVIGAFLDLHLGGNEAARAELDRFDGKDCRLVVRGARPAPPGGGDFRDVLDREGPESAVEMVRKVKQGAPEALAPFEARVNQAGYELLGAGNLKGALLLLALNVECFPNSVNAYDSLGEVCLAAGDLDQAESCYQSVLKRLKNEGGLPAEQQELYRTNAEKALETIRARRSAGR